MMRIVPVIITTILVAASTVRAQTPPDVKLPPSPRGSAAIQVGGTWTGAGDQRRYTGGSWVTVDYGRPILRGRDNIFGSGETYGQTVNPDAPIWRAGANETTRLTTQVPLVIGGTTLQPGEYNVFVDLKENAWTLVLSTQPVQPNYDPEEKVLLYGAYNYDAKHDVLRAPMRLSTSDMSIEQFTIGFGDVRADQGVLYMAWDHTVATVDFAVKK